MATSSLPAADRHVPRSPLPGGIEAARLPSRIGDGVLDEALRSDAEWLLLDASGAEEAVEQLAPRLVRALERSSRAADRTCLVCRRRLTAVEVATFARVEDACQAQLLAEAGFGVGWSPAPVVVQRSHRLVALR
jgi:hypothetical protein